MVFNSLTFLFIFLPVSIVSVAFVPKKTIKNVLLLVLSFLFFAWENPFTLVLLVLMILWNYISAIELNSTRNDKARKISFIVAICINLLILCLYKYTNFFLGMFSKDTIELTMPMGLSFFTFSALSYLIDVYTKKCPAQMNLLNLSLYISFFGKVSMGPIVQYNDMEKELNNHPMSWKLFGTGMYRFVKGLIKKVLLADQLSLMVTTLTGTNTLVGAWTLSISYMLQLYFDFSGYSDMAIGIGNIFGFQWKENFDHPYISTSIQDFWRRWHISLSTWFRDYLYFPLGGSRVETKIYIRNMFVVWLATGIWHGANWTFIIWGIYYGVLNVIEKLYLKSFLSKHKHIGRIYTLLLVLIGWVFFMSADISTAFHTLGCMVGFASSFSDSISSFTLSTHLLLLFVSVVFCTNFYTIFERFVVIRFKRISVTILFIFYLLFFIVCVAFIVGSTVQSFLYFAF